MLTIVLESLALGVLVPMVVMNGLLFLFIQGELVLDPFNYACLSLVFPVCKLPTATLEPEAGLKVLFWLVFSGNCFLLTAFLTVYSLYYFDVYNPWCKEDLNTLLFPEEWFNRSFFLVEKSSIHTSKTCLTPKNSRQLSGGGAGRGGVVVGGIVNFFSGRTTITMFH
jgi:hypothetical protein